MRFTGGTIEFIKNFLRSMYRTYIQSGELALFFNGQQLAWESPIEGNVHTENGEDSVVDFEFFHYPGPEASPRMDSCLGAWRPLRRRVDHHTARAGNQRVAKLMAPSIHIRAIGGLERSGEPAIGGRGSYGQVQRQPYEGRNPVGRRRTGSGR